MRSQLPLSVRLDTKIEQDLGKIASRVGLKKATLAQLLLEAAVAAVSAERTLALPIKFALVD